MKAEFGTQPVIDRHVLERLGDARLHDAEMLSTNGRYAAAVYLGGYAVECWLKVAICARLDWTGLYSTFKIHDLDILLAHGGLQRTMELAATHVAQSFKQIVGMWKVEGAKNVRYEDPSGFSETDAKKFLDWINAEQNAVLPWVKAQI